MPAKVTGYTVARTCASRRIRTCAAAPDDEARPLRRPYHR